MNNCIINNKKYGIPTKDWLVPLKKLINGDISTQGMLLMAKLIDKEKVIVKISNDHINKLYTINNILQDVPNFNSSYCVLTCNEKSDILDTKYMNAKEFCSGNKDNNDITLEIMKYYDKGSINNLPKTNNLAPLKKILDQLLCAQLEAFYKYGFLHNDIHKGNILFEKNNFKYIFSLSKFYKPIIFDEKNKFVLADFNNSDLLHPVYRKEYTIDYPNKKYYDIEHTLPTNILATFKTVLELHENGTKIFEELIKLKEGGGCIFTTINGYYIKSLRSYLLYDQRIDYESFINSNISYAYTLCNRFYNHIFKEDFIEG